MHPTGAEITLQTLTDHHVDTLFGYPGACVIPLLDQLYHHKKIKHILVRHEQGAVHAACGYAMAAHRPGVVLVTSGPGATNTITGIADAYYSGIPLIILTGQVSSTALGTDAFQEADMVNISAPITKWNYQITRPHDIAPSLHKAFRIATTGRPGPVLLDITKDALTATAPVPLPHLFTDEALAYEHRQPTHNAPPAPLLYEKVLHSLNESTKDILLIVDKQPNDFYAAPHFKGNKVITSAHLGVPGFGLPAAIGASFASTGKTLCLVAGTNEFQHTLRELGIIKQEGVDLKIILLNDAPPHAHLLASPHYTLLANAYGIAAQQLHPSSNIHNALQAMLHSEGAYLLEICAPI